MEPSKRTHDSLGNLPQGGEYQQRGSRICLSPAWKTR